MSTTLAAGFTISARARALLPRLRSGERVAILFFVYLSVLSWFRDLGLMRRLLLPAVADSANAERISRVVRYWLSIGLILAGYWSVGLFAAPMVAWQARRLSWDRTVLDAWGLRGAVESAGFFFRSVLESAYLLLRAAPPVCLCVLYWIGGRERAQTFLFTLLLGTFTAHTLLPHSNGLGRNLNLWLLDHLAIPTNVFPSGHVAIGFSTAFGMYYPVRFRPVAWGAVFAHATAVSIAAIYWRCHYAVDGLASIGDVAMVSTISRRRAGAVA